MSLSPAQGFLFAAVSAGIKASGKPDLALALAPDGASAAAMFTQNQVAAAPIMLGREHLRRSGGLVHAVIVNAGNANCATGKQGLKAATQVCTELSRQLKVKASHVFPSSTGIIGVTLPAEKIIRSLSALHAGAQPGEAALEAFANAILTTDTHAKIVRQTVVRGGKSVTLTGVAKGAGMIHPNMATMLVYVFSDVMASPGELNRALKKAVDESFHNISIDGDTSTNDTALLLASGKSGIELKSLAPEFQAALTRVCRSLAAQIIADGEGVKHVVRIKIEQARNVGEARRISRAIANSLLVKTAWAGADPNWGRMLAALGYSGVTINPERVNLYIGDQQVCRQGAACPFDAARAHRSMSEPAYEIRVALGLGSTTLEFLSCDLTAEYVSINADYST